MPNILNGCLTDFYPGNKLNKMNTTTTSHSSERCKIPTIYFNDSELAPNSMSTYGPEKTVWNYLDHEKQRLYSLSHIQEILVH